MKLGMHIGLDPGHTVLDGDPAPLLKNGTERPIFGPCLLWPNRRPSQLLPSTCYSLLLAVILFRQSGSVVVRYLVCFDVKPVTCM